MTLVGAPTAAGLVTTGLNLWLDANDISTLWQDSGFTTPVTADTQSVAGWQDKSGNARHFNQTLAATNFPTYRTNITGGKPAILFDGTDDYLSAAGANALAITNNGNGFTLMMAVYFGAAGTLYPTFYASTDASAAATRVTSQRGAGNTVQTSARRANADAINTASTSTTISNSWCVASHIVNHAGDSINSLINNGSSGSNTLAGTTGTSWPANNSLAVQVGKAGGLQFHNGYIAEICAYNRVLTSAEQARMTAYLRAKWGF